MLNDYLLNSTIHGLRYLSSSEKGHQRFIWLILLTVQFVLLGVLVAASFQSWHDSPSVRTSCISLALHKPYLFQLTNNEMASIRDIPFPEFSFQSTSKTRIHKSWWILCSSFWEKITNVCL